MTGRVCLWFATLVLLGCGGGGGAPGGTPGTPDVPGPPIPPFVTVAAAFQDVTAAAGMLDPGTYRDDLDFQALQSTGLPMIGGACAGDFDRDGWVDVYHVRGASGRNKLYRNLGDGTFVDVAGVDVEAYGTSGPTFVDIDGDGWLDLFLCGVDPKEPRLFRNDRDGTFTDITAASGLTFTRPLNLSCAFGDYDRDGDLDLYVSHWEVGTFFGGPLEHLWQNNGDGTFSDVSAAAGITVSYVGESDWSFTPNFADLDGDGWLDILLASDYGTTRVFRNDRDGTFTDVTSAVISDKNGMGATVGDYDNDGDLDWFVSAILHPVSDPAEGEDPTALRGNRLYRNLGDGTFEDATAEAGVRPGYWGWGSVFADFNNDCWLDIFHTNGWFGQHFIADPSLLYMSRGDGTFQERAVEAGIDDPRQGRGVVCFDYDRDGDQDLLVANLNEPLTLFRNDTPDTLHYLRVRLVGPAPNTEAVGARVRATLGGLTQMRELRCGSNYLSSNPVEAHFGLGVTSMVDQVRVTWPDGTETVVADVEADQVLVIRHPSVPLPALRAR